VNSGAVAAGIINTTGTGNAATTNSGSVNGMVVTATASGNASVINSGTIRNFGGTAIVVTGTTDMLTNIVGGRVIGGIVLGGVNDTVNFVGGNWLFTFNTLSRATINTNGVPFVASGNTIAVLDQTSFALADRALMNFTGDVQEMLQGRFDGMTVGGGGGMAASTG
jgi:hypothetical protein